MSGDLGPPDKERPGARNGDRVNPEVGSSPKSPTTDKAITAPRQCRRNTVGRRADAWCQGFAYGFRDALRLAQRELDDPHAWCVLARMADEYDLAGGDD